MIRRSGGGRMQNTVRRFSDSEEVNPMEGVANLVDAMLVLAVGMMLAVIINWNVDLANGTSTSGMTPIDDPQVVNNEEISEDEAGGSLEEAGTVYYDSATGQYYVKVDGGAGDAGTDEYDDSEEYVEDESVDDTVDEEQ